MTPEQYLQHLQTVYAEYRLPFECKRPATEADPTELAATLGPLDPALAALWRITEGSNGEQPMFQRPGFVDALELLTPKQALVQARNMEKRAQRMWDLAGPASADMRLTGRWWHAGWLPFASFYGDIVLLVDKHPGAEGSAGQIIAYVHDPDEMQWVAPSFESCLQASADSIDQDREEFLLGLLEQD
ncbi:MAG: SMI1/KNR4 family protein [Comamonas sp.]|jgi:cell wall assembly regulator SMI1|uniref:SMI1/KNR4 family protein n=1 Tax=Comamonas sp. TaxID=34028 RepID=UPI00283617BA|nr:SMI1/KNR4 family protein [Comamonas sp.]MDR0215239.1 SMI1/KNR4 family protein [Comamonas sp.]